MNSNLGGLQKEISLHWELKRSISEFPRVLNEKERGREEKGKEYKRKASKKSTAGLCKPSRLEEEWSWVWGSFQT